MNTNLKMKKKTELPRPDFKDPRSFMEFTLLSIYLIILISVSPSLMVTVNADQTFSSSSSQSLTPYQKGELFDFAEDAFKKGDYDLALNLYLKIADSPDVIKRIQEIKTIKNWQIYNEAESAFKEDNYDLAIRLYEQVQTFADSEAKILICEACIQDKLEKEAEKAYDKGYYDLAMSYIKDIDTFNANVLKKKIFVEKQQQIYNAAEKAFAEEDYDKAVVLFSSIPDYLDSTIRATLSRQKAYEERVADAAEEEYERRNFGQN